MQHHPSAAPPSPVGATPYEIRVRGKLGRGIARSFPGFDVEVEPAETILRGSIEKQEDLHSLLSRLEAYGLELVEVRNLESPGR
jgi:hypothetical protein